MRGRKMEPNNDTTGAGDTPAAPVVNLEVSANCSLTLGEAKMFFAVVVAGTLIVSGGWAVLGFWPILPFAGLELFVLGLALGLSMRSGAYREIISVSEGQVTIERGTGQTRRRSRWPRAWTVVELEPPAFRWHASRLLIGSQGKQLEVGRMLTEDDRVSLHRRLRELIGGAGEVPAVVVRDAGEANKAS